MTFMSFALQRFWMCAVLMTSYVSDRTAALNTNTKMYTCVQRMQHLNHKFPATPPSSFPKRLSIFSCQNLLVFTWRNHEEITTQQNAKRTAVMQHSHARSHNNGQLLPCTALPDPLGSRVGVDSWSQDSNRRPVGPTEPQPQ